MPKRAFSSPCSDRVLDAAIDQFGQHGIDGTSTRAIAAAAGTAMSSITYHYSGKEGIYLAAAQHIANRCQEALAPSLERARADIWLGEATAFEKIDGLVVDLLHLMLAGQSKPWERFVLREQLEPTPAFNSLYETILERVTVRLSELIAQLGGERWSSTEVRLKTFAILSHVRMFCAAPELMRRTTGLDLAKPSDVDRIERFVRGVCRATLDVAPSDG
ncbi:hypothetical protein BSL82_17645 (plasmid) [Tardibacter chloracetimidivorans]|uniref:HTH tetR-type domain-containing protein n=2 Tax=Sphingomonadaceae TaxID=41297 RepID=A0A1L4A080_9SPHN|nr:MULTISPECIES: CerR family C-terminal domain-containing protein [Sphingomonadaceae]API61275.1 hypothetical protein BSL82_17645 [Tardibacter chloracetimidivorans]MBB4151246.1 AcrR family transcriptional regulator [Sphingobium scionense]